MFFLPASFVVKLAQALSDGLQFLCLVLKPLDSAADPCEVFSAQCANFVALEPELKTHLDLVEQGHGDRQARERFEALRVPPLDALGDQAVQSTARLISNLHARHLLEVLCQCNEQLVLGVVFNTPKLRQHLV